MGFSKLKIPKICEQCGKAFEAKTVVTRFCSPTCANKSGKEKKKQAKAKASKAGLEIDFSTRIGFISGKSRI